MTIDYLSTAGLFFSVLTWQTTATPELVLFSQWLLSQSYFTLCEEGHKNQVAVGSLVLLPTLCADSSYDSFSACGYFTTGLISTSASDV